MPSATPATATSNPTTVASQAPGCRLNKLHAAPGFCQRGRSERETQSQMHQRGDEECQRHGSHERT